VVKLRRTDAVATFARERKDETLIARREPPRDNQWFLGYIESWLEYLVLWAHDGLQATRVSRLYGVEELSVRSAAASRQLRVRLVMK
jgi:hypothetical protein